MIRRPRPTVRLRLTLTYTVLFAISGAALLGISYLLVRHETNGPGTAIEVICDRLTGPASSSGFGVATPVGIAPDASQCPSQVGHAYQRVQINANGGTISGGGPGPAIQSSLPAPTPSDEQVQTLTAAVSLSQSHTLDSFRVESAIALGIITVLSFGVSWLMAGRALAPVHRITETARSLSERTLDARIRLEGPDDELRQLADTFDAMLGRLERSFTSQRRFVANASHELRTPLATERVLIDEALADPAADADDLRAILHQLRSTSEDTERLIDALLVLARSERGVAQWSPVDLAVVVQAVLDRTAPADVTVSSSLTPAVVSGDPGLLERLAGNLVENAVRHNGSGGTVGVVLTSYAGTAVLEVDNTGPVIDPAVVADLVEPFRRAGPDRASDDGGVGLGLSIVDAVVTAHHGTLTLAARPEGGLHVQVRLPLAAASD